MATKPGTRRGVGVPRPTRAKQHDGPADLLDETSVARSVWTLIDLATAWELATSRGERNQPLPDADKGAEALFARAVAHIGTAARAMRRDFSTYAFGTLTEVIAELYEEHVTKQLSEAELRRTLRVVWRRHPAVQLVLGGLTEDAFVARFVSALQAGAKTTAVERVAAVLGLGVESGWKMRRRSPKAVGRPFGAATSEASRLRFVLSVVFPDVDTADIADKVLAAIKARRAARERVEPRALERVVATTIPWPLDDPGSSLEEEDADERFRALSRVIADTLCCHADPKDWAHVRYGGEIGEFDDAAYRAWLHQRTAAGDEGGGEDFVHEEEFST